MRRYAIAQLDTLDPRACPCGTARRAFADQPGAPTSVHLVEIKRDAEFHFHTRTTEIYVVLEGEGWIELDGERVPVRPLSTVMIHPGCVHRAVGPLRLLNLVVPPFDPADEHLAGSSSA